MKLLVLGPEGVGKTSLIEALRALAIQPRTIYVAAPGKADDPKKKTGMLGSLTSMIIPLKSSDEKAANERVPNAPPKVEAIDIAPLST